MSKLVLVIFSSLILSSGAFASHSISCTVKATVKSVMGVTRLNGTSTFSQKEKLVKSDFEQVEIALEDDKSKRCLANWIDLGIFDKKLQKTILEQHQQAFWKWNHAVKIGAIKPKTNSAGHLLKTLGLIK